MCVCMPVCACSLRYFLFSVYISVCVLYIACNLAEPHPRAQAARGSGVMIYLDLYHSAEFLQSNQIAELVISTLQRARHASAVRRNIVRSDQCSARDHVFSD